MFADPTRPTALAFLKRYPSAQAVAQAEVGILSHVLRELSPKHYGRRTAEKLLDVAKKSISSGVAISARSTSLRILCDQLEHTRANLQQLQQEIETLLDQDPKAKGVLSIPEFGVMTVAVLRAELGDLDRFARMDQVVAYVGLDRASSSRVANGLGRPNFPNGEVAACVAFCISQRCEASSWTILPLEPTITAWLIAG